MDQATQTADKDPATPAGSFLRDEDGTILFFAVTMMIVMFMLAGMGVDIMRFESTRTDLQQTADRATLAATSGTQILSPTAVVADYFAKAGLADKLTFVEFTKGLNFRTVRTEARANTNPIFLRLYSRSAVDQIQARALSVAEQRITNVEISLVLDVSGSMAGSRMSNLKTSATEFIDTVLATDTENKMSISIVPYNGQINMTQDFQNLYVNRTNDHNVANVNCFDLPASAYTQTGMSTNASMPVTGHVDTRTSTGLNGGWANPPSPGAGQRWCPPSTKNVILPPTNNATVLKSHINGLVAEGATSINAGMKWGMTLLDPGSRNVVSAMITQGKTPAVFQGRPYDYEEPEMLKVLVLMTDGEHFAEERLNDGYRTELSPIFYSKGGQYSIFHDSKVSGTSPSKICSSRPYYVPHLDAWQSRPWNGSTPNSKDCFVPGAIPSNTSQQTWNEVWEKVPVPWVAGQLYRRAIGVSSSTKLDEMRSLTPTYEMDDQLRAMCGRARDHKIVVYGIAFEAPSAGISLIRNCSSTPGHFFDANGLEIQTAFRAIASNISQLRLTQ